MTLVGPSWNGFQCRFDLAMLREILKSHTEQCTNDCLSVNGSLCHFRFLIVFAIV
jgi:hypothetical protein